MNHWITNSSTTYNVITVFWAWTLSLEVHIFNKVCSSKPLREGLGDNSVYENLEVIGTWVVKDSSNLGVSDGGGGGVKTVY